MKKESSSPHLVSFEKNMEFPRKKRNQCPCTPKNFKRKLNKQVYLPTEHPSNFSIEKQTEILPWKQSVILELIWTFCKAKGTQGKGKTTNQNVLQISNPKN